MEEDRTVYYYPLLVNSSNKHSSDYKRFNRGIPFEDPTYYIFARQLHWLTEAEYQRLLLTDRMTDLASKEAGINTDF